MVKERLKVIYIMSFGWSIFAPTIKPFFNHFSGTFWSLMAIWGMIVVLSQKWLSNRFNITELMRMLFLLDILYVSVMLYSSITKNIDVFIFTEEFSAGFYVSVLLALDRKIFNIYFEGFKASFRTRIEATIQQRKLIIKLAGVTVAGILMYLRIDPYYILMLSSLVLIVGIRYSIPLLK